MKNRAEELVGKMSPLVEPSEDWHEVGASGEPAFENSWANSDTTRKARFYKHIGRVYLAGLIDSGSATTTAFTLPEGYRPDYTDATNTNQFFLTPTAGGGAGRIQVLYDGSVVIQSFTTYAILDGISFRAG